MLTWHPRAATWFKVLPQGWVATTCIPMALNAADVAHVAVLVSTYSTCGQNTQVCQC